MADHYLISLLGENEHILFITRQHWLVLFGEILSEIVIAAVIGGLVTLIWIFRLTDPLVPLGYLLLLLPAISLLRDLLIWKNHQYVVTNRRVIQIAGVFSKEVSDSSLEKVNDVKLEQSFWGRLFGYGSIEILTASELGVSKFNKIGRPIRLKTAMLNAKESLNQGAANHKKRPDENKLQKPIGGGKNRFRTMLHILATAILLIAALCLYVTQPLIGGANISAPISVDSTRLETHVRALSQSFVPRDGSHPENLDSCAAYIQQEFERANARVSEQPFTVDGKTYRNVVARFGPETKEMVVVGAHYDTAGPLPGADDNASGVAGLLELARLLGDSQLPTTVELAAYTLEEPSFFRSERMGSAMHAEELKREGVVVRIMFSLEMIGYFNDARNSQHFPSSVFSLFYPTESNFILVVGKIEDGMLVRRIKKAMTGVASLPVYSINAPRLIPGVDLSDHLSFWRVGYPAVMITDTAFYRNANYHTLNDTAERLDYRRMGQAVEEVYAAVIDMAR
ncbi:MAG: M28 family peptidase [Chloracidobacterium sp.]|nr:M28 family peptidase [Chloracidobacterium sp.]